MVGRSTAAALATMSAKSRPCSLPRERLRRLEPSKTQSLPRSRQSPSRISVLDTRRFIASSHRNSHVECSNLKVAQSSEGDHDRDLACSIRGDQTDARIRHGVAATTALSPMSLPERTVDMVQKSTRPCGNCLQCRRCALGRRLTPRLGFFRV